MFARPQGPSTRSAINRVLRRLAIVLAAVLTAIMTWNAAAHAAPTPNSAGLSAQGCWQGARKFIYTDPTGNQHHIVEFDVNVSVENSRWYIAQKPTGFLFSASVWPEYYNTSHKWVGYQWPYNWWDPYSPSSWVLCYA
jgi:hypothetical protein